MNKKTHIGLLFIFSALIFDLALAKNQSISFESEDGTQITITSNDDFETATMTVQYKLKQDESASGILLKAKDGSTIHFKRGEAIFTPVEKGDLKQIDEKNSKKKKESKNIDKK